MDRYDGSRVIDPPFSSIEKGEVEHCAVTKYSDERVTDSAFTIKSEREKLLKSQPYVPQRYDEDHDRILVRALLLIFGLIVAAVVILLL